MGRRSDRRSQRSRHHAPPSRYSGSTARAGPQRGPALRRLHVLRSTARWPALSFLPVEPDRNAMWEVSTMMGTTERSAVLLAALAAPVILALSALPAGAEVKTKT